MIEQQLYQTALLLTGVVNLVMALALLNGNMFYADYKVYCRARLFTALWLFVFGVGYLIHAFFQLRYTWPAAASALSVSYFHIGGVLFGWGHTSLLNPQYINKVTVVRDLTILSVGLVAYWWVAFNAVVSPVATVLSFSVFFFHCVFIIFYFFHTYRKVRRNLIKMSMGNIGGFVRWMSLSCHLIMFFGVGSVAVTAAFPVSVWPYTLLLCAGMLMFIYIFYSITEYGTVIDMATNATEDVANLRLARLKTKDYRL